MKTCIAALAAFSVLCFGTAALAESRREPLYDVVLDFNHDGVGDRAVLVLIGRGRSDTSELSKERYGLSEGEEVQLEIYFGAGSAPLDITKKPDVVAANVINPERGNWILPLQANGKGGLKVTNADGWGSSNEQDDTITVVWRGGAAVVAGYTLGWETRDGAGTCDVNLLSGKAVFHDGVNADGPGKPVKGKFKLVPLARWSEATRPKACDKLM